MNKNDYRVSKYIIEESSCEWEKVTDLPRAGNDNIENMLQLKLSKDEELLFATTGNGFVVWTLENKNDAVVLMLPNGVRNIATKMLCSSSIMLSGTKNYAVAGVR